MSTDNGFSLGSLFIDIKDYIESGAVEDVLVHDHLHVETNTIISFYLEPQLNRMSIGPHGSLAYHESHGREKATYYNTDLVLYYVWTEDSFENTIRETIKQYLNMLDGAYAVMTEDRDDNVNNFIMDTMSTVNLGVEIDRVLALREETEGVAYISAFEGGYRCNLVLDGDAEPTVHGEYYMTEDLDVALEISLIKSWIQEIKEKINMFDEISEVRKYGLEGGVDGLGSFEEDEEGNPLTEEQVYARMVREEANQ